VLYIGKLDGYSVAGFSPVNIVMLAPGHRISIGALRILLPPSSSTST